ncbi:MAG: serine hydrolase [Colwellia sp.]|nr:serine hydrolase [Colwellia sp.]
MVSIKQNSKKALVILVILLTMIVTLNWEKVSRLHAVITLFDKAVIVNNFSHMEQAFWTKKITKSVQPYQFTYREKALPAVFEYQGKNINVDEFLTRRATTALLVLKNDKITFEHYYLNTSAEDKRISWSMAKSFVSVLFGMQVDAGKIDIEKAVAFYLPEMQGSGYEKVKIKHVLQMSSGVKWNEDYQDFNSDINKMGRLLAIGGSLDKMTTELSNETTAGEKFHYVSMDTHVIAMILRRVSGQSLVELVQHNLWNKIGMESDAAWITDSQGHAFALGGLNATTRDYARFGRLLLNNGRWQNEQLVSKQLVSREWIQQASTAGADHLKPGVDKLGYGYQIWLPPLAQPGEFFCVGVYGQYIYVNQQQGVVIVKNSADKIFMDGYSKQETLAFFRAVVTALQ